MGPHYLNMNTKTWNKILEFEAQSFHIFLFKWRHLSCKYSLYNQDDEHACHVGRISGQHKGIFQPRVPCLETFLYKSNTKLFMHLCGVCGAHLNYASERFPPIRLHLFRITPQINPDKSPFLIHASPFTLKSEDGSCYILKKRALHTPGLRRGGPWSQRSDQTAHREETHGDAHRPDRHPLPLVPLSSLHHGFTPGARPALHRINFG